MRSQSGFTMIEVIVAMALLLTAVLGLMSLADSAAKTSTGTKAREGAISLAREVAEDAGGIAYSQLNPATLVANLQALPGLASTGGPGWTIVRRDSSSAGGFTYTVTATMCSIDDSADQYGSRTGVTWCTAGVPSGTGDSNPEDFKRVTIDVSWTYQNQSHTVRQTALFAKNGAPDLPVINSLVLTTPSVSNPSNPTISTTATTASFTATATSTAQSVQYSVDGVNIGSATLSGGNWTFSLSLTGWTDGAYAIGARAVNAAGVPGPTRTLTLTLARSTPAAPAGFVGGRNYIMSGGTKTSVAEFNWLPNAERNVLGYRVYRPGGTLACPGSMSTFDLSTSCIDTAPVDGAYTVVALYRNASGTLLEGPSSSVTVVPLMPPFQSYYFKNATAYTGTNCGTANAKRDADDAWAGGTETTFTYSGGTSDVNFCTRSLASADSVVAGNTQVSAWVTNTSSSSNCSLTATLGLNSVGSSYTSTLTVPKSTSTPTLFTWTIATPAFNFATGDRVNTDFSVPNGPSCDKTSIYYSGTTRRSRLDLPNPGAGNPVGMPNAPTGLTGVVNADGSRTLTWTAPAGGNPVANYQIYRDGTDVTQRYDVTGDNTPTYTDPNTDGGTHSYYITAVSTNLAESSYVGPITP